MARIPRLLRLCLFTSLFTVLVSLVLLLHPVTKHALTGVAPESSFNFTSARPAWLAAPSPASRKPLVLRIGIITLPDEVSRRAAIRSAVLAHVPQDEVQFEYRFFMGTMSPDGLANVDLQVRDEAKEHGDIVLLDMQESKAHMGEKRWHMFKWGAEADASTYDFYMGVDSDSFLRLAALARRFHHLRPNASPRSQSIMWAHMLDHWHHWKPNTASSANAFLDEQYEGDWFPYPWGMGYLFSSHLMQRLMSPSISLPYHVPYPYDDVLLGSWVHDYAPDTDVVQDKEGFHDPTRFNAWHTWAVSYDTVCIHHVRSVAAMVALRRRPEWADEWEGGWDETLPWWVWEAW